MSRDSARRRIEQQVVQAAVTRAREAVARDCRASLDGDRVGGSSGFTCVVNIGPTLERW